MCRRGLDDGAAVRIRHDARTRHAIAVGASSSRRTGGHLRGRCRGSDRAGARSEAKAVNAARPIRLLALSPIPEEGAGCRFRIAQFIPYLQSAGFDVTLSSLFTTDFFRLVYKPGHYVRKAITFAALSMKRLGALRMASEFDVILLYREMFPIGPAIVERLLARRSGPPIVFDFDDAIFLPSVSDANRLIAALKQPRKVASIVEH